MPTFAELADDFEDGTLDTGLWSGSYGDPDEPGGRARIPCTTGYAGLKSGSVYTLTGSGITIRLHPPAPNGAVSAVASCLVLTSTGGTDAGFIVDSAQTAVGLYLREGYADGAAVFLTYNATDHAWLRFRENAGTLYWDTSPDGVDWTNRRTATTPTWAADTDLAFLIEGHRDAGTNDFIEVDSVNVPPFRTVSAAASLTADSTLTVAGIRRQAAESALGTDGLITASGTLRANGASTLTSDSVLAAAGIRRALVATNAADTGTLTAVAARTARGTAALTASGALTVADTAVDLTLTVGAPTLMWEVGAPWL
jgi:hypothetical protein